MSTLGASSAPSSDTKYYDALLTSTLDAYRKQLVDNIYKEDAYLAYLRRIADVIRHQNGGQRIAIPLMYADNDTITTHAGYDVIDTTPQDGLTTAFYEWAEIAGSISINRKEERQNAGEGKLLDLLKAKITQAEMTMREKLNRELILGAISGGTFVPELSNSNVPGVLPLGYFLPKDPSTDPTVGGNVGNISRNSYSWWRPVNARADSGTKEAWSTYAISVSTWALLVAALKRVYNGCARGTGGAPDLVLTDQLGYETYETALDAKTRYMNTKMADMGFDNIKLKGATVIWDEFTPEVDEGTAMEDASTPTSTFFFINTKFYSVVIDSETDIVTTPFVEPENQTAKTAKILFMGNATCSNIRKMGVLYGVSQSLTS